MRNRVNATRGRVMPLRDSQVDAHALLTRWREHADVSARDALAERFMPLARKLALRYAGHEPLEDLVQVAAVGLLGAIDRFDPDRGGSFTAFAIPTILGEIKRHFRDTGWAVHVPRGAQEMALQVNRAVQEIPARPGRPPGVQELAEYLDVSTEDVWVGLSAGTAHFAASLDAPTGDADTDEPRTLIDTLPDTEAGYGLVETTAALRVSLTRLPYLERQALSMRMSGNLKQTEIGAQLGCSQMQVSRLLRRATTRLRTATDPPA
jgi:RNA polymerase sigma-B factor